MSLLSSDVFKITHFLSMTLEKIKNNYKTELQLNEWNVNIDDQNLLIIKKHIKNIYYYDSDFLDDINKLAEQDETDIYRTILKIIDILDLSDSKLDNSLSKIFLGSPHFNNCGEEN
jgi:CRISPR/Cas system CSM-associated protein Csm4 (group 5 of RAMP superfamily)